MTVEEPGTQGEASTVQRVLADYKPVADVRADSLTYRDFLEHFARKNRPVVIRGAAAHWPAVSKWTPQHFKERFGRRPVSVTREKRMPFDEFIDAVEASTDEKPGPYMFRCFVQETLPELLPEVMPKNQFTFSRRHASRLIPAHWYRPDGYLKLLVGGYGSKFPVMHFDGENAHAFITQIYGVKEFVLFSPDDSPYMYHTEYLNQSGVDDPIYQDRVRFPLMAKATPYRTLLEPGDTIFVPSHWWHSARTVTTCISVCTNMLDSSNWDGFVAEVAGSRRKTLTRWRLHVANALITAMESLQDHRPQLARALKLPRVLAPVSIEGAPDPTRILGVRMPFLG